MCDEVVVQLIALTEFEDQPDSLLGDNDLVEAGDVRVDELTVVMDLAGEVGVVARSGLEDDLCVRKERVSGEVYTAE